MSSKNSLESYAFNVVQPLKMKNFKARSMMRTNRRFFTSIRKLTGSITKLHRRKNVNISRKCWKTNDCNPIISKLYHRAGGMPGGIPVVVSPGPTMEEVD